MFIRETWRTIDWGDYDVEVVATPAENGREDLAEAIEALGGYNADHLTPPDMGLNQPTYMFKS